MEYLVLVWRRFYCNRERDSMKKTHAIFQSEKELPLSLSINRPLISYGGCDPLQLLFGSRGTTATAQPPNNKYPTANPANSSCPSIVWFVGSLPQDLPVRTNQSRPSTTPPRNLTYPEAMGTTLACTQLEEINTGITFLLPN
jgi:hypothetical protein